MDSNSPGNYGLMDIIQVLKWVQKYIERFHGKKHEVSVARTLSSLDLIAVYLSLNSLDNAYCCLLVIKMLWIMGCVK